MRSLLTLLTTSFQFSLSTPRLFLSCLPACLSACLPLLQIKEYAALVAIGRPTFIEIKGVTFCGDAGQGTAASSLTMGNVPFHEEVRDFALKLTSVSAVMVVVVVAV